MSLARKQALISGSLWLAITVAFFVLFFRVGPEAFTSAEHAGVRHLTVAIIMLGYLVSFVLMARARRGQQRGELDERDKAVELKAAMVTLTVMVVGFYLATIGLYSLHSETGAVPAGWLYFLAYTSVTLVSLVYPVATLIIDYSGAVDG